MYYEFFQLTFLLLCQNISATWIRHRRSPQSKHYVLILRAQALVASISKCPSTNQGGGLGMWGLGVGRRLCLTCHGEPTNTRLGQQKWWLVADRWFQHYEFARKQI